MITYYLLEMCVSGKDFVNAQVEGGVSRSIPNYQLTKPYLKAARKSLVVISLLKIQQRSLVDR